MTDSVANMLTIIRNAQAVKKESAHVPYSSLLWNLAKLLEKEGYLKAVNKRGRKLRRTIETEIPYDENGNPIIHGLRRVSKPGKRIYQKSRAIGTMSVFES